MKYIHSRNIVHLNLKPETILISEDGIIKISGFDNSKLLNAQNQNELNNDVYSFGVVVYFILSGGQMPDFIVENTFKQFSDLALHIFISCCSPDVKKPSFKMICDTLAENEFNMALLSPDEAQELSQLIKQYKRQV